MASAASSRSARTVRPSSAPSQPALEESEAPSASRRLVDLRGGAGRGPFGHHRRGQGGEARAAPRIGRGAAAHDERGGDERQGVILDRDDIEAVAEPLAVRRRHGWDDLGSGGGRSDPLGGRRGLPDADVGGRSQRGGLHRRRGAERVFGGAVAALFGEIADRGAGLVAQPAAGDALDIGWSDGGDAREAGVGRARIAGEQDGLQRAPRRGPRPSRAR